MKVKSSFIVSDNLNAMTSRDYRSSFDG